MWIYGDKWVDDPHDPLRVEEVADDDANFAELLNGPRVAVNDEEKEKAPVLCGARYALGVKCRDKEGVDEVTCLVLDVDHDAGHGVPYEQELRDALAGLRAVVYSSPSHTKTDPHWRVLLPLATPLPPKKYRSLIGWLSENLVPSRRGCINVTSTGDPTRLGFVMVTKHPDDYVWFSLHGDRFAWTNIPLEDEVWVSAPLSGMARQPTWIDRPTALARAKKECVEYLQREVARGEHRIIILFNIAMVLWWDWGAEDEEFVREVLLFCNSQFWEEKPIEDVEKKMREAHQRTVGEKRRPQHKGPYGFRREPSTSISRDEIKRVARLLKKSVKPGQPGMGEELVNLVDGKPLTVSAEVWTAAIKRACNKLAEQFQYDSAEKIASFFASSLSTMRARGEGDVPNLEQIEMWIGSALVGARKRREERQRFADKDLATSISHATHGKREHKYSFQEWDAFQENGCGLTDKSVLLQYGRLTWVFVDGTYEGPYTDAEFDAQGYKDLAAAQDFVKAKVYNEEKGSWTYVKLNKLLQDHGSKCTPQMDYMCERSYYRPEDRVLVLAGPAKSGYEPKFHTDVDEWFRRMTGRPTPVSETLRRSQATTPNVGVDYDDYDVLCDWLASITQLDHTCAALYLQGEKHVGKNLFAEGVGRIWKAPPNSPKSAFHHFNGPIASTPLIHADEDMSPGMTTSLLRRELAGHTHEYTMKHKDTVKLIGCFRLIITANNLNVFTNAAKMENLNGDDVNAFGDRFVRVKCRPEAKDFLLSLGLRAKAFHDQGLLAEHALWLVQQRWNAVRERGHRFLVESRSTDVALTVATGIDLTSEICTMLANALASARDGTITKAPDWFIVREGKLWLHAASTKTALVTTNMKLQPSEKDIVRAVQSVSEGHRNMRVTVSKFAGQNPTFKQGAGDKANAKQQKMWNFRLDALRAFLENTPIRDWSEIEAGVKHLDEKE